MKKYRSNEAVRIDYRASQMLSEVLSFGHWHTGDKVNAPNFLRKFFE